MKKYYIIILVSIFFFTASNTHAEEISLNRNANIQAHYKIEANNKFIWQGDIKKAGTGSFEILQETVAVPQDLAESLTRNKIIEVGNTVQVSGIFKSGIKIAKEVKLISSAHKQTSNNYLNKFMNTIKVFLLN